MSLRLRLTLLYTTLLVGILLVFGSLVYWLINVTLLDQVDTDLTQNANSIVEMLRVNENSQFDVRSIATFRSSDNLEFQIWNASEILVVARPLPRTVALDERTLRATEPVFTTNRVENTRLRVLTVPLVTGRGQVGTLQLGIHLELIDLLMRTLAIMLIVIAVLASAVASLWIWLVNGRALAPLATMSRVATQISHAEDLSRRIPQVGAAPGDEVDQLIQTFNETLERLEQLFITQRRFLADVSHELRTPLTVIKGNVGLMRKIGEADEESLVSIEGEVDRLTRMVGDLLLLAQAESGRLPLAAEPVELDTVLLEVFQQMRLLAGERIQVRVSEIDQVQVTGDRDRLKQVLLNLVGNAVQYTPAGGLVMLSLRKTDTQARLTVTDSGPGIAAQDLPHIFERFYRGEKSRKRAQGTGFGLGLSIAYWIVRSHQGTIEVQSKEGQGTEFTIYLPLKPVSPAPRNA
ncbi:MAG TPA: HAMP domain-containing sensor histidine kinase [Anaerolineaceae bacterium]